MAKILIKANLHKGRDIRRQIVEGIEKEKFSKSGIVW